MMFVIKVFKILLIFLGGIFLFLIINSQINYHKLPLNIMKELYSSNSDFQPIEFLFKNLSELLEKRHSRDILFHRNKVHQSLSISDVEDYLLGNARIFGLKNISNITPSKSMVNNSRSNNKLVKTYLFSPLNNCYQEIFSSTETLSSIFPIKISLIEDTNGDMWLQTFNLDLAKNIEKFKNEELSASISKLMTILGKTLSFSASGKFP